MADLVESAHGILSTTERRLESVANNVANLTTAGYKSERLYSDMSAGVSGRAPEILLTGRVDLHQGRLSKTGNSLDLAIAGRGMFRLSGSDGEVRYSRSGQFRIADGRLVTSHGLALQSADGGDVPAPHANIRVLADGTVLDRDIPIARIALHVPAPGASITAAGGSLFTIFHDQSEEVRDPQILQGMVEASNVSLADEMVSMMDALRQAESGARLVQAYDDLVGRAINTFGQGTR